MSYLANLTTEADNHVPQLMFQDSYCSAYSKADINHSTCNSVSKNTLFLYYVQLLHATDIDNFQLKSAYMKSPGTHIVSTDIQRCCRQIQTLLLHCMVINVAHIRTNPEFNAGML